MTEKTIKKSVGKKSDTPVKKITKKTTSVKAKNASVVKKETPKREDFSVIKTGGKQYKVSSGDVLKIEKILGDFNVGDTLTFDEVLLTKAGGDIKIGMPLVSGAKISAVIEEIGRNKKISVIKYRAKSRYFKNRGHRQPFMKVRIK